MDMLREGTRVFVIDSRKKDWDCLKGFTRTPEPYTLVRIVPASEHDCKGCIGHTAHLLLSDGTGETFWASAAYFQKLKQPLEHTNKCRKDTARFFDMERACMEQEYEDLVDSFERSGFDYRSVEQQNNFISSVLEGI